VLGEAGELCNFSSAVLSHSSFVFPLVACSKFQTVRKIFHVMLGRPSVKSLAPGLNIFWCMKKYVEWPHILPSWCVKLIQCDYPATAIIRDFRFPPRCKWNLLFWDYNNNNNNYYYYYLLQISLHPVAVVFTTVQTKQIIYINETIQNFQNTRSYLL
jgi:hypothetical protein